MAAGQLVWGVAQTDRGRVRGPLGSGRVLAAGIAALAIGMAVTPFMTSNAGLCSRWRARRRRLGRRKLLGADRGDRRTRRSRKKARPRVRA
jgi:hypothetical protein